MLHPRSSCRALEPMQKQLRHPTSVPTTVPKSPLSTRHLKAEKPTRILARLPTDHIAWRASPIDTLQKLRRELTEPLAAAIKGVQNIPTGIAITVSSLQGMEALLAKKDEISAILTSAQVEKEERWVTCIVPGLQPEYQDYEGRTQTLTAKQAAEEFTRITGVTPQLCRWNRAQPERPSNALVLAFPPKAAVRLPKTVEIYGTGASTQRDIAIATPAAEDAAPEHTRKDIQHATRRTMRTVDALTAALTALGNMLQTTYRAQLGRW
ncbi:hypothetical protein ACJ73_05488 [Blastomyces percursus]|uniref:Uncharacterized protein n=1 Tax=Blastomyces percursus TaxID=1658174 RepID=A0A1J9QSF6_9EURO|nr:hypothetical protein ACJ73_05488 [Blastomyces percursus]